VWQKPALPFRRGAGIRREPANPGAVDVTPAEIALLSQVNAFEQRIVGREAVVGVIAAGA